MRQQAHWSRRHFLATACTAPAVLAQAGPRKLRAGAALVNITPSLGCSLAGGMTDRIADEIHDELHVRALALDNGESRVALATVDSCAVPRTIFDQSKELIRERQQVPASHVLLSATHTHSAPPAGFLFQSKDDPKYTQWLAVRIADAVSLAFKRLEPARIGWGVGREDRLVFNRRWFMKPGVIPPDPFGRTSDTVQMNPPVASPNLVRPAGPIDPDVCILAVEALDGRPISVLGSYALHYVGGGGGTHVTADYFGMWAGAMARLSGVPRAFPPFVPLLANACSGNINGVNFRVKRERLGPYEQMRRYAEILAAESYRTWRTLAYEDSVELKASIEELDLGIRKPAAAEAAEAKRRLEANPPGPDGNFRERPLIYAHETVRLHELFPDRAKTFVQAIRIGNLAIATFPGEAFVELGLEVKAKSPFKPTFLIELANDYRGYIPTVEGHQQGGYETWRAKSSYLEKEAAPKMVASALRQLERLA